MQANIDLTVKKFFDSVKSYTSRIRALYTDKAAFAGLDKAERRIEEIRQNIKKLSEMEDYSDEKYKLAYQTTGVSVGACLFMKPDSYNNGAYRAFIGVISEIVAYYEQSSFVRDPKPLLDAIKSWRYQTSTSLLKDFIYPFLPLSYFAEKGNNDEQQR